MISIEKPTGKWVSVYIAVLTYVAMVFRPIQHKYITHFIKIAIEAPISLYTNTVAVFCFLRNLEGDDETLYRFPSH